MTRLLTDDIRPAVHIRENDVNPLCNATIMERHHAERVIRPEVSVTDIGALANAPRNNRSENCGLMDNPLPYSDATYDGYNFISRKDDSEWSDKNYEENMPSELAASTKLDEGKTDCASDYHEETCVSSCRYERMTRNKREETAKSDHVPSRDQRKSRCRSTRRRKRTRRQTPEGIIIDLSNDLIDTKRSGIKINVISMHNLTMPSTRFVAISKPGRASKQRTQSRSLTRNSKRKENKTMGGPILAVFYTENRDRKGKTGRLAKRECNSRQKAAKRIGSTNKMSRPDAIAHTADQSGNALNERLRVADNSRSFCASDEILDSMKCCHRDAALLETDNARCLISSAERARRFTNGHAEFCHSIFHDQHQEHQLHACEEEDYNVDTSDFNTEAHVDCMSIGCIHAAHAERCRCFCTSCEYYPNINSINMQLDHHCSISRRTTGSLKNFIPPERRENEEIERFGPCVLEAASVTAELEADEYSHDGGRRCASCDEAETASSSASTTRKCTDSKASVFVEAGGSVDDLRDFVRGSDCAPQCGIDADPEEFERRTTTLAEKENDEWPHKSDSSRGGFTCATTTSDCIEQCCESTGEAGGFARGMDPKWVQDSIETDAQQLDYKWKRRIATMDDVARMDSKEKRDSRYKSEEAIRVQLRERMEIRKRESLQMVEATSQTREDNTSTDGKRHDYFLWSLQMGKIWSQVHDACRNVAKLAATSVGRIVKNVPPKSERSRRSPEIEEELPDATYLADSSSSHVDGICGDACRGNLMRPNASGKSDARKEECRTDDAAESRDGTEISMRKKSRTSSGRNVTRKCAYRNLETMENGKSCLFHDERKHDEYRDIELLPRNETYDHDEAAYPQSRLSGSFTYFEDSVYPGFRSRGGSDDNRDFARSIEDKQQKAARRTNDIEETESIGHQNSVSESCVCHTGSQTCIHCADSRSSLLASHELSVILNDVPDVSPSSLLHHEVQSVATSISSIEQMPETYINSANLEAERKNTEETMPETVRSVEAPISSTKMDATVRSLRNDLVNDIGEPIASTSTREAFTSSRESQTSHVSGSRTRGCVTAMRFCRRRRQSAVSNKAIAPVLKRKIRNAGRKKLLSSATHDDETKITQIEPSTMHTAGEGNKRRAYVNVQVQTSGVIVTRILSELLVAGEKMKSVLMSITLQPESNDDDVSNSKEAETQTPSSDVTSVGTDAFDCPDQRDFPTAIATTTRTVQCFVCNKRECYEIKRSDDSITLEEALIAEYSEETLGRNDIAKRRTDESSL